jgi:hypothetical protein
MPNRAIRELVAAPQDVIPGESAAPRQPNRYTLVVTTRPSASHPMPWGWEIYRDGQPLPARLREFGFKTEHTATAAGRVALRDFLAGLAREESRPDW